MKFVHTHNHSEFSFLDGVAKVEKMAEKAKEMGHEALALTDHGTMSGVIAFYSACKAVGIKPLLGIEFYMTPLGKSRLERIPYARQEYSNPKEKHRNIYHLVAIAKNEEGFSNLCKLTSSSFIDGFYQRNRIDMDILKQYHKGLIVSSACLAGEINHFLSLGNYEHAKNVAKEFKTVFDEDFYLEIQNGGYKSQADIIPLIHKLGKELDIKVIATNDAHYVNAEDSAVQDYMLLIGQRLTIHDDKGLKMGDELYLKNSSEMLKMLPNEEESLDNTNEISDKVNLDLELGAIHIPVFDIKTDAMYKDFLLETGEIDEEVDSCGG